MYINPNLRRSNCNYTNGKGFKIPKNEFPLNDIFSDKKQVYTLGFIGKLWAKSHLLKSLN